MREKIMIKIEHRYAPDIIQQYEEKMLEKIKRHYQSEGLQTQLKFTSKKMVAFLNGKCENF